ncbi:MAG: hypothetical protein KDD34_02115 [Bdellovibrionales bacterium]|nr:hypothetical protein [Bdellovibrionales bacterium]
MTFPRVALFLLLFLSGQSFAIPVGAEDSVIGKWQFYKVYFQGEYRPPFSEELQLFFEFTEEGKSRLYYFRKNESGFCEREGKYTVDGEFLIDEVTWVNPQNNIGCGQDPDMQKGQKTTTKIAFENGDFYLYLNLKGEPLVYIWRRLGEEEQNIF